MSDDVIQTRRRAELVKLAEHLGVTPAKPSHSTSGEDLCELLDSGEAIGPWVAITRNPDHGIHYLYPRKTREAAEARAVEFLADPTFHEEPVFVHNLDTSLRLVAELSATWKAPEEPVEQAWPNPPFREEDEAKLSDRAVAARRGDFLEAMGWPTVAEDVRAGLSLGELVGRLEADDDILPVVRGWIDG